MQVNTNHFKNETSIPKTNQGFLWNISDPKQADTSMHILSLAGHIWANPLQTNPKVKEVFQNSKTLYLEHPPLDKTESLKNLKKIREVFHTPENEINHELLAEIKDLASDYLSKTELLPFTKKIYSELLKINPSYQDAILFLYLILINHREAHCDLQEGSFTTVASKCVQEVRFLQSEKEYLEYLDTQLKLAGKFLNNKVTLLMFKQMLKDHNLLKSDLRKSLFRYHAWCQGDTKGINNESSSSSFRIALTKILKEEYPNTKDRNQALDDHLQIANLTVDYDDMHRKKILKRLPDLLSEGKPSVVVLNSEISKSDIVSNVDNIGLKIQQVAIPMKARGFFWKIKDKEGRKNYLLGTQHYAPQELINLNTKIQNCFNKSQQIGVEIDITRDDIIEKMKNFSKKEDLKERQYFESQSLVIQEALIMLLKLFACKKGLKVEAIENRSLYEQYLVYKKLIIQSFITEIGYQSGIELDLIPKAKKLGKPVHDLENLNSHMERIESELNDDSMLKSMIEIVLNGDSESKMEMMYEQIKEKLKNRFDELSRISIYGYTEKLIDMLQEMSDSDKRIFNKSNYNIALKIDELIQESNLRNFFMVGALHFLGEHGLIKLLEGLGYTAKQVIIEEPL